MSDKFFNEIIPEIRKCRGDFSFDCVQLVFGFLVGQAFLDSTIPHEIKIAENVIRDSCLVEEFPVFPEPCLSATVQYGNIMVVQPVLS
jgi:hypothetical protein